MSACTREVRRSVDHECAELRLQLQEEQQRQEDEHQHAMPSPAARSSEDQYKALFDGHQNELRMRSITVCMWLTQKYFLAGYEKVLKANLTYSICYQVLAEENNKAREHEVHKYKSEAELAQSLLQDVFVMEPKYKDMATIATRTSKAEALDKGWVQVKWLGVIDFKIAALDDHKKRGLRWKMKVAELASRMEQIVCLNDINP
eukprot:jgi/Chlat1/5380/Chrsp35S00398